MKTSQNNSNKTERLNRAKILILLLVSCLSCLALFIILFLHSLELESTYEVLWIFVPMLVFFCIILFVMEDINKREIISRKEKEIRKWLNYSARLFGIIQESKVCVENIQKKMSEKDSLISKEMQDLYKTLSGNKPS